MPLYTHGAYDDNIRKRVSDLDVQHTRLIFKDLEDELTEFCRYVPPVAAHMTVYSTKLWGLILRACAEIDSQLHGLVEELQGKPRSTNIRDYIAIEGSLQLAQGELITRFEQVSLVPFASFVEGASPAWWKDYNSVKHRRLDSLESATLGNALSAVGGLYIVLVRQWGEYLFPRPMTLLNAQQIAGSPLTLFSLRRLPW